MDDKIESFEELEREVMRDFHARCAAKENNLRRQIAGTVRKAMDAKGWRFDAHNLTAGYAHRDGMKDVHCARRVMGMGIGGDLPLRGIVKACDLLDIDIHITLTVKEQD